MKPVVDSVLPLFALVLAGYLCARRGLLGADATKSLNLFVVWLALPALLFQVVAETHWSQVNHPAFVVSVGLGMLVTFLLSAGLSRGWGTRRPPGPLPDASIQGLAASYPNTGFMGIPLCLVLFGRDGLPPAIIATILTVCVLFGLSLALIEIGLQAERAGAPGTGRALLKVGATLARNPLLMAPLLGLVCAVAGLPLPRPLTRFTGLLGGAASPCALVTLGLDLFLAQSQNQASTGSRAGQRIAVRVAVRIVVLKMIVQPLITGVLVFLVFNMPRLWSSAALLLSALPIGTGPFMLAKLYDRDPAVTSRAILWSTLLSLVTLSALVAWIVQGPAVPP
jgi:malonate transporter